MPANAPRRLLVTGFGSFPGVKDNPSGWLAQQLASAPPPAGWELRTVTLPVSYRAMERELTAILADWPATWVVAMGVSARSRQVQVEARARNLDHCALADADGEQRLAQPIVAGGPAWLPASVPAARLLRHLRRHGVVAQASASAGTYCCNHLFYHTLYHAQAGGPWCNFLHLPPWVAPATPWGYPPDRLLAVGQALLATAASLPATLWPTHTTNP